MSQQEKEYLAIFRKQMEALLGWGDSDAWSNTDFEKLNELIFEKTGVNISISTLKRVLGKVRYDSIPTTTTLNTLVQFAGYESWRCFCTKQKQQLTQRTVSHPAIEKATTTGRAKPFRKLYAAILVVIVLGSVFLWMSFFSAKRPVIDRSKIKFTSRAVTDDLPNSVVFDYDIGDFKADDITIQQSWDPARREKLPLNQRRHTSIYYTPGYFNARLLVNNTTVSQHDVYIKTKGWKGIVQSDALTKPVYLNNADINGHDNSMEITTPVLASKVGTTVFNDIWTTFWNMHEFPNINPTNFSFNTTIQNTTSKEGAICRQAKVYIFSSDGFVQVPLCAIGCTSDIELNIANSAISGKNHDLSAFGCDFSKPRNLGIVIKDKTGTVLLDDKSIFTTTFTKPLGRLVGLLVCFEGTGEISAIDIK